MPENQGERTGMVRIVAGVVDAVGDLVAVLPYDVAWRTVAQGLGAGSVRMFDGEVLADDEHLVEQGVEDGFQITVFDRHVPLPAYLSSGRKRYHQVLGIQNARDAKILIDKNLRIKISYLFDSVSSVWDGVI